MNLQQEFGDFGILIHGGWPAKKALIWNFIAALPFLFGGILSIFLTAWKSGAAAIIAVGAGNFMYIATTDLLPEVNRRVTEGKKLSIHDFEVFMGLALLLAVRIIFHQL